MKKLLVFAAWVGGIITHWLIGTTPHTLWLRDDQARQSAWEIAEHARKYGAMANMVIGPITTFTSLEVHVGTGTNRHPIEFGFRDDGTVVWRRTMAISDRTRNEN